METEGWGMPVERFGPYVVLEELASGGMGRVLLARSPGGRTVAVKTLLADSADDRRRFAREVRIAQRVRGIYTASVIEADAEAAVPWMATEYIPAPSLRDLVESCGVLGADALHWIAAGIAEALLSIHGAELVHRDIKPSNVLLPVEGPRVIDFGISQAHDVTRTQAALGTVAYASPEQARGEPTTAASDVFSLGATLFHLAVGRAPYRDGGAGSALEQLVRTAAGELDVTGLPGDLEELILPCLRFDAAARPAPEQIVARAQERLEERPGARSGKDWLPGNWTEAIEGHRTQRTHAVREARRRVEPDARIQPVQPSRPTAHLITAQGTSPVTRRPRNLVLAAGGAVVAFAVGALLVLRPWTAEAGAGGAGEPDGPVGILPVLSESPGVCPADSPEGRSWTSDDRQTCVVTADEEGLTLRQFKSVRAFYQSENGLHGWTVEVTLDDGARAAFSRLTEKAAGQPQPRNELAFVIQDSGRLLANPAILEKITGPKVPVALNLKRNEARFIAQALGAR
ncbi:protein kinase [Streptomyces sp. NPDC006314]|uniref:serine/threonine-protein kinase n=1 Tax=Streptomyces sp. NPDC006314 TaxID=3154475 RepID=UPI0033AC1B0F